MKTNSSIRKDKAMKTNLLAQLIHFFKQNNSTVDLAGKQISKGFYYRNPSQNRKFKGNRRKEMSLSRRRKMRASAR